MTPICVLAGCLGLRISGWIKKKALSLLEGIYSTVVVRDILEREKRRGQRQITDSVLLRKIVLFLADNIGSSVSVSSIGNTLMNEGLLEDGKRRGTPSPHTVQAYIGALLESYFFYEIKRFDIKGRIPAHSGQVLYRGHRASELSAGFPQP